MGKAPVFDGTGNVEGFIRRFKRWSAAKGHSDEEATTALQMSLRGRAQAHEDNVEYPGEPTVELIFTELRRAFGEAAQRHLYELQALKRNPSTPLADYNEKFTDLHSKASRYLNPLLAV